MQPARAAAALTAVASPPRLQRRRYHELRYKKPEGKLQLYKPKPWEQHVNINPRHRGSLNDEGMEHFWVAKVMDRVPDGVEVKVPDGRLTTNKWRQFYDTLKEETFCTHPMPVTQWFNESGWLYDHKPRENPALDSMRNVHENLKGVWVQGREDKMATNAELMSGSRQRLLEFRTRVRQNYTPIVPCDILLDWIEKHAAGRRIVELQARLGYWSWQLRQRGYPLVTAYEEWADPYTRRGHKYFTDVIEDSGEVEIQRGDHNDDVLLIIGSDRELEEMKSWDGDTLIYVGQGAIGGVHDIGQQLINRNEGWRLVEHQRLLRWPLFFDHAYLFQREKKDKGEQAINL